MTAKFLLWWKIYLGLGMVLGSIAIVGVTLISERSLDITGTGSGSGKMPPSTTTGTILCNVQEWQWAFKNHLYNQDWFNDQQADLVGYIDSPYDFAEPSFTLDRDVKDNPFSKPTEEAHIAAMTVAWPDAKELVSKNLQGWVNVDGIIRVSSVNAEPALVLYASHVTALDQPPADRYLYHDAHGSEQPGAITATSGDVSNLHKNGLMYGFSSSTDPALPQIVTGQILRSVPCSPLYVHN